MAEIRFVCFCMSVYTYTKYIPTAQAEGRNKYQPVGFPYVIKSENKPVTYFLYFGCNQTMCAVQL